MGIIENFVSRYRKEYDFYDQAARLVAQSLDAALQSAGIRAIVTSRAKSPTRLEDKLRQRDATKHYTTVDDISADIVDLAGARVALYFPGERDQVGKLIRDLFTLTSEPKDFPGGSNPSYSKRFSGYWATHYRARLRESMVSEAQRRYVDAVVEVQVASVLMHAWAEVEHDLVYKPLRGRLSVEEYSILDELNGLVMAGEVALERLQRAGEARVAAHGRKFTNHYELAAYLLDKAAPVLKGPASDSALGRVDLLHSLLNRLDLATPDRLDRYIGALNADAERRPLAEQVVDQLLAEDESRYPLYEELKSARDRASWNGERQPDAQSLEAIGLFLSKWIEVEHVVREILFGRTGEVNPIFLVPTMRNLERSQVSNRWTRTELESLRKIRNNLVHGIEIPEASVLTEAAERLDAVREELKKTLAAEKGLPNPPMQPTGSAGG